jgi:hypothetical protein
VGSAARQPAKAGFSTDSPLFSMVGGSARPVGRLQST